MQKEPFVSVLIANYNNSSYIQQCINSLNSQTYKNLEIIFFDDNSSDNSLEIIKKFSNVKIIENKIQTKFASLNQLIGFKKAAALSKGELIKVPVSVKGSALSSQSITFIIGKEYFFAN